MAGNLFCTPQWLNENETIYLGKSELQEPLKNFSKKMAYRVTADPSWGIDEDILFCTFFDSGKLTKISVISENDAMKEADFLLSAIPQTWKKLLTGESNFPMEFSKLKIKLEKGGKLQMLSIAPYSRHVITLLTQVACKFPDEMSAQDLEEYRNTIKQVKEEIHK